MATTTENRIAQRRKAKGILVPILEDLFEKMVEVEDDDDIEFMERLMRNRMRERQKGVFSPSLLSSCMRQAYFVKTQQEKRPAKAPASNAIFIDGDFRHYKWQFALWKAHRAGLLELIEVELRVYNKAGDFVGTIDALVVIDGKLYVVDFKGMNVRSFMEFVSKGIKVGHGIQITGYMTMVSDEVEGGLLIGESKGGPIQQGSPLGLHEELVPEARFKARMKKRLATLRRHVEEESIPEPACVSTRHKEYQECPFSWFCYGEVKEVQKQRERAARSNASRKSVALSTRARDDRAGRRGTKHKGSPA